MLELKNLKKVYKTKSGEVFALNGINLTFPSTGMVFITGKSGCGKTTLLNVIGGLDSVDEGNISIFGRSFSSFSQSEYDDYRNTFIGFIFQEYNLLPEFTVEKNIKIAMELQGSTLDK
ncbi:MAG: ATP-binding cassette domain-containing protein, partial [Clostridia bacterium]|nr:ATP-binding cassette domain-containing protein [Clostridia bacterium]